MLAERNVMATVAVSDLDRARAFYSGTLGFRETGPEGMDVVTYRLGNTDLLVYRSDYAGTNKATSATWSVGDELEAIVTDLRAKGVGFDQYDWPGVTYKDGIHDFGGFRGAWFRDPDGNILHINGM